MQYKNTTKIIIDKRKLDVLIRLGCPDEVIFSVIKTGTFKKTNDDLVNEILESFCEEKSFKNWGGNHNPKGINGCKTKEKLGQVDHQLEGQDIGQDVDKDKDIDKDIYINNNIRKENNIKEKKFYVEQGKFYIDDDEKYCAGYTDLVKQIPPYQRDRLCEWFFDKFQYREISLEFIRRVLQKAINGGVYEREYQTE